MGLLEIIEYPRHLNCYANKDIKAWVLANNIDSVVELHRDSFTVPTANGYSTQLLAGGGYDATDKAIHEAMVSLGFYNRGMVYRSDLYNMNQLAGICSYRLIELGFITNVNDNKIFDDNLSKIGQLVYKSCADTGVKRLGIIYGHGGGDPGGVGTNRTEADDVRKISVVEALPQIIVTPYETQLSEIDSSRIEDVALAGHVQGIGWQGMKYGNELVGSTGQSLRLEAIKGVITQDLWNIGGKLEYMAHLQGVGDTDWIGDFNICGSVGESRRIEGAAFRLTDKLPELYDVLYRGHLEGIGNTRWYKNGEFIDTKSESRRLEGIQVILVRK